MATCLHSLAESLFLDSASLRYPWCKSKLAGDGGAEGRASRDCLRHQERGRKAGADPKTDSSPRSEGRLGFWDFLSRQGEGSGGRAGP